MSAFALHYLYKGSRDFSRVAAVFFILFPFHRCGRFGRDVVDHAADRTDLVCNAAGSPCQKLIWQARPVGGHEVVGGHRAQSDDPSVGAGVTHDTDAAVIRQHGEVLARTAGA